MAKNVLFITWDGPQTSYLEGLFIPIFDGIQKRTNASIHIIQFTWSSNEKIEYITKLAQAKDLQYSAIKVSRKPSVLIGSTITLYKGVRFIQKYIEKYRIDILMPRSTFPAVMVNYLSYNRVVVFDADGLPLEERIDFSNLSRKSFQFKYLKSQELKLLRDSDRVLVRTEKAIKFHLNTLGNNLREKFFIVRNGRSPDLFKFDRIQRDQIRKDLNIGEDTFVFVYCGSLGPQYGIHYMINVFEEYRQLNDNSRLLLLSGNPEYLLNKIKLELREYVIQKTINIDQVPRYLSASDFAFGIREPSLSMQGVSPIKLGEYLLMGLPLIASRGIGDTEIMLRGVEGVFLFDHSRNEQEKIIAEKLINFKKNNSQVLRSIGLKYFSLEESVDSYLTALRPLL